MFSVTRLRSCPFKHQFEMRIYGILILCYVTHRRGIWFYVISSIFHLSSSPSSLSIMSGRCSGHKSPEKLTEPMRRGQMFLGMNPPLSVSFDPAHSVFNMACVCCSQVQWKEFRFCLVAPGAQAAPLWVRELALRVLLYCVCRRLYRCPEAVMRKNSLFKQAEIHPFQAYSFHLETYINVHLMQSLIEDSCFLSNASNLV